MIEIVINTEKNDDWMKSLPGYAGELAIHKAIAARLERKKRNAQVADELGKKAEKHLQGKHDQKTHGSWAGGGEIREESEKYEDVNRLKKIHYEETKSVNSAKLMDDVDWGNFIALDDGTFAHCAGPGYFYHTYLAAGRILSHPEKYKPHQINKARKVIDWKYDEDLETESAVGKVEKSLSFARRIHRGISTGKIRTIITVKGTGSTTTETQEEVANRAFRLVKKLTRNGAFSGVDQFYFHGIDQTYSPIEIEEISWISKLGVPHYKHYKHLTGKHDQKLHGSWATGRKIGETSPNYSGAMPPTQVPRGDPDSIMNSVDQKALDMILSGLRPRAATKYETDVEATLSNSDNRESTKDVIVRKLVGISMNTFSPDFESSRQHFDYTQTNAFINSWAGTSNKSPTSQVVQLAVAEELGSNLSEWQDELKQKSDPQYIPELNHLAELVETFVQDTNDVYDSMTGVDPKSITVEVRNKFSRKLTEIKKKFKEDVLAFDTVTTGGKSVSVELWKEQSVARWNDGHFPPESLPFSKKTARKIVRKMYDHTQAELKKHGYKETDYITVFRGISGVELGNMKAGEIVRYAGNAAESWSLSSTVAKMGFADRAQWSVVLATRVPIKRILSTCRTGLGCLPEQEIVVLGDFGTMKAKIIYVKE